MSYVYEMFTIAILAAGQLYASVITYDVTENMPVQLECNVTLDVPANQSYRVTWYQFKVNSFDKAPVARREGAQVTMYGDWLPRVSILSNGSLYFPMTNFQHDDALYHCQVISANGFNESVNVGLRIDRKYHFTIKLKSKRSNFRKTVEAENKVKEQCIIS